MKSPQAAGVHGRRSHPRGWRREHGFPHCLLAGHEGHGGCGHWRIHHLANPNEGEQNILSFCF